MLTHNILRMILLGLLRRLSYQNILFNRLVLFSQIHFIE